jgi:type 1 glutamine amidotransferase
MAHGGLGRRTFLESLGAAASIPLLGSTARAANALASGQSAVPARASNRGHLLANLICGGAANDHDLDFARRRLLDVLYDIGGVRTEVWRDYSAVEEIEQGDLLVSYSSLIVASPGQAQALRRFIERGGRWFALHASNYVREPHQVPEVLGSRFLTHPPYGRFTVIVTNPGEPVTAGLGLSFEVVDELYVMDLAKDIEVLLHARWGGRGVLNVSVPEADQPLMYRRRVGAGGVLYLALGHSNRQLDPPQPNRPAATDRRGSWGTPVFDALIRRGIEWAAGRRPL